ncbi:MAG: methionine gamma-lyase family protein, partial [Oscillospiraceae bacterium]
MNLNNSYDANSLFNFSPQVIDFAQKALAKSQSIFQQIDKISQYNCARVLKAFKDNKISEAHLGQTTGYGYDDIGRDATERVAAQIFGAEDCLFRHNFQSGTHAIATALFAILKRGDVITSVTGTPYDTLQATMGINNKGNGQGNFNDLGIIYKQIELIDNEFIDVKKAKEIAKQSKVIYIQRSRGYSLRKSISLLQVEQLVKEVKSINKNVIIIVDNCYCEFVSYAEPCQVGADLIIGSLIKNPGGGLALTGGYIAGRKDLVDLCGFRLTAPGVGREIGCTMGQNRNMLMGLFFAPHTVAQALKTAVFAASLFNDAGFQTSPKFDDDRADIIQSILLNNKENLISFCQGVQSGSPVDAFALPEPWAMPGYDNDVIMAAGAFTMGA